MSSPGHGVVGSRKPTPFTNMLPLRPAPSYPIDKLAALAEAMKGDVDTPKDGDDPEENLCVPAGYTYFGQFIDHDLTFDSTSSLNPADTSDGATRVPTNLRSPRFDLDCVYGDGPDAQPFMYADDGATLLYGGTGQPTHEANPDGLITSETASWDLLRAPNGRAIIGDKRNDENSIVSQIQLGFVKYHNAVVQRLKGEDPLSWNAHGQLFRSAQNEVRWTYQRLVVEDFLPRIVAHDVLADLQGKSVDERQDSYVLYKEELRTNLPREFVAAAYRFGHSGVRTGYRLNRHTKLSIFPASNDTNQADDSLLGFDPLPKHHVIENWDRFFTLFAPNHIFDDSGRTAAGITPDPKVRLQFAYKLDTTIVDPLGVLPPGVAGGATDELKNRVPPPNMPNSDRPSLALLNLVRGDVYQVASGQDVADRLIAAGKLVSKLTAAQLVVRKALTIRGVPSFQWTAIDEALQADTPLWFYVLAEAQAPLVDAIPVDADRTFPEDKLLHGVGARTQLGWVGGRIIAEVFYGLLDSDEESFVRAAPSFAPKMPHFGDLRVRNLLKF